MNIINLCYIFQNVNYNGSLLPHLPGGSHNGSPDMRLAASNLSLGSNNAKNKGKFHCINLLIVIQTNLP